MWESSVRFISRQAALKLWPYESKKVMCFWNSVMRWAWSRHSNLRSVTQERITVCLARDPPFWTQEDSDFVSLLWKSDSSNGSDPGPSPIAVLYCGRTSVGVLHSVQDLRAWNHLLVLLPIWVWDLSHCYSFIVHGCKKRIFILIPHFGTLTFWNIADDLQISLGLFLIVFYKRTLLLFIAG